MKITFLLAFAAQVLVQGQVADVAGEWRVGALVYTLRHSVVPPLAMIHKDLDYGYFPSLPTITISGGTALGFLQPTVGRRIEGELAFSEGCWIHLSLEESEDGSTFVGFSPDQHQSLHR
jgi:hypothetical protein